MRQRRGPHDKKRLISVSVHKSDKIIEYEIIGIIFLIETLIIGGVIRIFTIAQMHVVGIEDLVVEHHSPVIGIEERWIVCVCLPLTVIAVKTVEALPVRLTL